mgnify:CR=1 FL=1
MVGGKSKLWKLRAGVPVHKNVTLGNGDSTVEVTVVSLPADTMQMIDETVESYCRKNKDKINDTGTIIEDVYLKNDILIKRSLD